MEVEGWTPHRQRGGLSLKEGQEGVPGQSRGRSKTLGESEGKAYSQKGPRPQLGTR